MGIEHAIHQDLETRQAYAERLYSPNNGLCREMAKANGIPVADKPPSLASVFEQVERLHMLAATLADVIDDHERSLKPVLCEQPCCDQKETCAEPKYPNALTKELTTAANRIEGLIGRVKDLTEGLR